MKKVICFLVAMLILVIPFTGCSEAARVNENISRQAGYFECLRKITVYNARTDKVILEMEGYMDISNNTANELVVTCKTGPEVYKKNYVYLNKFTIYVVEDITGTYTDPYHYKIYFHTENPFDIELKP